MGLWSQGWTAGCLGAEETQLGVYGWHRLCQSLLLITLQPSLQPFCLESRIE